MPAPLALTLSAAQTHELSHLRDHDPTPYMRERAAAILKVAAGASVRAVAATGLLRPRRRETVATWVRRYLAAGPAGCGCGQDAGASPRFPLAPAAAAAVLREVVRRSPRLFGLARSRWRLADLGQVVPWLRGRCPASIHRILRRLALRYKRGRAAFHSPDLAYDAKLAAVTAAQLLARAHPQAVVLLYQDEFTYYRRPSVARGWAPQATDAPRADQGWGTNKRRRVAACLDAITGRVVAWQRHRCDRKTLGRFYQAVAAAYPQAEAIFVAQDNWPVHLHPDVLAALPPRITLLPLPTSAPWTNPVEDLWRLLNGDLLHHHAFGDDWAGLQAAVAEWLDRWQDGAPDLLRFVGLCPD